MAKTISDVNSSFEMIARQWHTSNKKWSESHSEKVLKSLESHVFPYIGLRDIPPLKTPDLLIPMSTSH